jgi:hypothetical protein
MSDKWKKVVAKKACDIINADQLSAGSRAMINDEDSPRDLIHKLALADKWPDALTVMANCLPRREAAWWACMCSRRIKAVDDVKALEAAEQWVFKPTDERRAVAFREAQNSASSSAAALAALAVASSSSRLSLDEYTKIRLDASTFPDLVVAAILVAEGKVEEDEGASPFRLFLDMGEDIAQGGNGRVENQ